MSPQSLARRILSRELIEDTASGPRFVFLFTLALLFAAFVMGFGYSMERWRHPPGIGRNAFLIANEYMQAGSGGEAAREYEALVGLMPWNVTASLNLGRILGESGEPETALEALRRARDLGAHDPVLLFQTANAFALQSAFDDATDAYRQAVALDPGYQDALENLGITYLRMQRHAEAADTFERALALAPGSVRAHAGLGSAYFYLGDLQRAVEHFVRAHQLDPDEARYERWLARARAEQRAPGER